MNIPIDPALLSYLDKSIPDRHPNLEWPERKVWFEAGRRSVVNDLKALKAEQEASAPLEIALKEAAHNVQAQEAQDRGGPAASPAAAAPARSGNRLRYR